MGRKKINYDTDNFTRTLQSIKGKRSKCSIGNKTRIKQMKVTDKITITNEDCMELLKRAPDKYYSLAICDPPYGIDVTKMTLGNGKKKVNRGASDWDSKVPDQEYFDELFRVSENQIIWGANYMIDKIKTPSMCWIFWDKGNGDNDFSDGELAWTSFDKALRKYKKTWVGANAKDYFGRVHATQKPVDLYKFLLSRYAKQGDKILDTHIGSMSIAIACHDMGFELTGCELDSDYYTAGIERIKRHVSQLSLFEPEELIQTKQTLF